LLTKYAHAWKNSKSSSNTKKRDFSESVKTVAAPIVVGEREFGLLTDVAGRSGPTKSNFIAGKA